jgi:putative chitinase
VLTKETLQQIAPKAKDIDKLLEALLTYMPKFGIDSKNEIAMFLAQACHESAHFTAFSENLNYSAKGLRNTWPSRFPSDTIANKYARQPRAIANYVYAGRYGNGGESSGDGWNYRGKGLFQTTFKANYIALEKATGIKCVANPDLLTQIPEAVIAACYFWQSNKLSASAEKQDVKANTKILNGGAIGLADRQALFNKIIKLL